MDISSGRLDVSSGFAKNGGAYEHSPERSPTTVAAKRGNAAFFKAN
jgi:hypothetical protein